MCIFTAILSCWADHVFMILLHVGGTWMKYKCRAANHYEPQKQQPMSIILLDLSPHQHHSVFFFYFRDGMRSAFRRNRREVIVSVPKSVFQCRWDVFLINVTSLRSCGSVLYVKYIKEPDGASKKETAIIPGLFCHGIRSSIQPTSVADWWRSGFSDETLHRARYGNKGQRL